MTIVPTKAPSVGERNAIKQWLSDHGASNGPEIDTTKLEGTGISPAALTKAAAEGPVDLAVLKAATQKGQRPDLDEKRLIAAAKLARSNTTKLSRSVNAQLTALTGHGVPDKAALTKLMSKAKALRHETDQWAEGEKHLAWLTPHDHQEIQAQGQALSTAYLAFANHIADTVAAEGKAPGPYAARALEQIRSDLLNVGSWASMLVPDETLRATKQARLLQKLQTTLGLSAEELQQSFGFGVDKYGGPSLHSTKPMDLDLSSRELQSFIGGRSWSLHQGDLNLADNLISSGWALPERVEGSVSLSNNALRELRSFGHHRVEITGDLDLSHNKSLRNLDGLERMKIGGDVNLVGVPATSLPHPLSLGGQLIFDASQTSLIAEATYYKLPHQVVEKPGYQPFQMPADPGAAILDAAQSSKLSGAELNAVVSAIPYAERAGLAKTLIPRIAGSGLPSKEALRVVDLVDYRLAEQSLAAEVALIPTDPRAPLPKEVLELPRWKLQALCQSAASADGRELASDSDEKPRFPEASSLPTPRADRILELLLEQARAGEIVSFLQIPNPDWEFGEGNLSRARSAPQKWELLAHDLESVRMEKDELYLKLKSQPGELPAGELFRGFAGSSDTYVAMESVAQRYPKNEAFLSTYRFLLEHRFSDTAVGRSSDQELRQVLVQEQILALASPSPALAKAMTKIDELTRRTTEPEAQAIAAAASKGLKQLGEHERGAVLQAILRQDEAELSRGAYPGARSAMLEVAGQIFPGLSPEQRRVFLEPLVFAAVDQLTNEPTEAAGANARLDAALASVPPWLRAYTLHEFSGALQINAKEALDRGVKGLINALPSVDVAKALRFSGWWYRLAPYREDLAAKLATIKVEGELAEHLHPVLENLKLLPG